MIFETFSAAVADTPPDARWLIAVSAGSDSVALLTLAREWTECLRPDVTLEVLHVQHGLRGGDSREDEAFCRRLAAEWQLRMHVEAVDVAARVTEEKMGIPAAARTLRLEAFERVARARRADAVLTAHHRDDQVETVLHRALRGSGPRGLLGIRARRPLAPDLATELWRPCLALGADELREWRVVRDVACREDRSNRERTQLRNRLRLDVLPELRRELSPQIDEWLLRLAAAAREIESDLRGELPAIEEEITRAGPFRALSPAAVVRLAASPARAAAWFLFDADLPLGTHWRRTHLEGAIPLLRGDEGARSLNLPGGFRLTRAASRLWILPAGESAAPPSTVTVTPGEEVPFGPITVRVEGELPAGEWVVRNARPAMPGARSLAIAARHPRSPTQPQDSTSVLERAYVPEPLA